MRIRKLFFVGLLLCLLVGSAAALPPPAAGVLSQAYFNGTQGSPVILDENSSVTWTNNGQAMLDTATKVFGSASANFTRTNSSYLHTTGPNLAAADWTFQLRVNPTSIASGSIPIIEYGNYASTGILLYINPTKVGFFTETANSEITFNWNTGQWYDIALEKNGSTVQLFIDGLMKVNRTISSPVDKEGIGLNLGYFTAGNKYWDGYIDEWRLIFGTGIYPISGGGAGAGYTPYTVEGFQYATLYAGFNATPAKNNRGVAIAFQDTSTGSPSPSGWDWDFNDGNTTDHTLQNPTHYYESPGIFSPKLNVTSGYIYNETTRGDYITVVPLGDIAINATQLNIYNSVVYPRNLSRAMDANISTQFVASLVAADWAAGYNFTVLNETVNRVKFFSKINNGWVRHGHVEYWGGSDWLVSPVTSVGGNASINGTGFDAGDINGWNIVNIASNNSNRWRLHFHTAWETPDSCLLTELEMYNDATIAPLSMFTVNTTSGTDYIRWPGWLIVNDTSTNSPTSYLTDWGDGLGNVTTANGTHQYLKRGYWNVTHTVSNTAGSSINHTWVRVQGY